MALEEHTYTELSQLVAGNFRASKQVTLTNPGGSDLELQRGQVLYQDTDYKFQPLPSDGTEVARAILAEDVTVPAGSDAEALVYFVGEYRLADIVWPDGISEANKSKAIQELQDRGIILK